MYIIVYCILRGICIRHLTSFLCWHASNPFTLLHLSKKLGLPAQKQVSDLILRLTYKNGGGKERLCLKLPRSGKKIFRPSDRIFDVIFRVGQVTRTKHFYEIRLTDWNSAYSLNNRILCLAVLSDLWMTLITRKSLFLENGKNICYGDKQKVVSYFFNSFKKIVCLLDLKNV